VLLCLPALAFDPVVTELDGRARVDWTALRLEVRADGDPSAAAGGDISAVEDDARHLLGPRFLSLARKVPWDAARTVGDLLDAQDAVADSVDGNLALWEVREARYHSGGAVELDAALALHAWLRPAAVAMARGRERAAGAGPTGLLIDARGVEVAPVVAPALLSADGRALYDGASLTTLAATQRLPAVWVRDPADPAAVLRVGASPLVVRPQSVRDGALVLTAADAARLDEATVSADLLLRGAVAVVVGR
jgi:hypothetical protein